MVGAVRKRRSLNDSQKDRPSLSPLIASSRRRRRRPQRVATRLSTLVALIGAIAVVAILATASGSGGPARLPTHARGIVPEPTRRQPRTRTHGRSDVATREQLQAIQSVLRYTTFISSGTTRHRVIALTFDDGPSPYTEQVMNVFTRMHVPATFFIVGQQLNNFSAALRDEVARQFVVGDHTENHALLARLPPAAQFAQIHDAGTRAQRLGAPFPHLFRPPYGAYNKATLRTLHQLDMLMVLWSVDPGDWRRPGVRAIVGNVLANARPGAIVLLHDGGGDRSQTVAALPAIINGLRRKHYELVTLPRLLKLDPPPRHQRLPHVFGV
jgi:peptidoglycan/xylan/chitin deacetylase (PgdA/CDA1 family)